jgi:pyruvate dehydrogenase E1 component alpha subunit
MSESYKKILPDLYKTMYKIREFENEGVKLYRQGLIRGYYHPYWGEEAIATGVSFALTENDYITSTHRGHGHCIGWGGDIKRMFAELLGKNEGYCRGLGGSMHIADITKGNLGANGIVGSGVPIGVGAALGAKIRKEKRIAAIFVSDGGTNIGSFSEGLNLAATWKLPVLFIIENNQFAVSTPIEKSTGEPKLCNRGLGYGVKGVRINGNDVLEVYKNTLEFADKCHKGQGPFIIEALTFRQSGHHVNDPGTYMPREKVEYFRKNDPLLIGKKYLKEIAALNDKQITGIEESVHLEVRHAIEYAKNCSEMSKEEFIKLVTEY